MAMKIVGLIERVSGYANVQMYLLQLKYNRRIKWEQMSNCGDIAKTAGSPPIYPLTIHVNG